KSFDQSELDPDGIVYTKYRCFDNGIHIQF
ncbi:unnamed protein product, partial [marine sediment metagenome]